MNTSKMFQKPPPPHANYWPAYICGAVFVAFVSVCLVVIPASRVTDSHLTFAYTSVMDKFSCVQAMYPIHITCCWFTFLSGLCAIVVRFLSWYRHFAFYNAFHLWCGRAYILGMLWTVATSSLIRNEGLPLATLISFLWVLGGLTFGWVVIRLDSSHSRALHAAFMLTSWVGIAGRIFNYNTHKDFKCYTYPVLKALNTSMELSASDPLYHKLPWADREIWGWGLPLVAVPFATVLALGLRFL
jgi:hypothetical protein